MALNQKAGLGAVLAVTASIAGILGTAHELFSSPPAPHVIQHYPIHGPRHSSGVVMTSPGYVAKVFSVPSVQASVQGTLANGATVSIKCTVEGDVATFGGKSSSLWNSILPSGYLPDVEVNTGSEQATMPKC